MITFYHILINFSCIPYLSVIKVKRAYLYKTPVITTISNVYLKRRVLLPRPNSKWLMTKSYDSHGRKWPRCKHRSWISSARSAYKVSILRLPEGIKPMDQSSFLDRYESSPIRSKKKQLTFLPGSACYPVEQKNHHLRLSYSYMSEQLLHQGVTTLCNILHSEISSKTVRDGSPYFWCKSGIVNYWESIVWVKPDFSLIMK